MSPEVLSVVKLGVALVACWVVGREVLHGRSFRGSSALLALLALLAVGAYFAPLAQRKSVVHRWEMFHYYLGSKFHRELGYERLYACVAVADVEAGVPGVEKRRIRDLETDLLITAERAVKAPESCKAHFSAARWQAFTSDVGLFRRGTGSSRLWQETQRDHGYNPPPLWTLVGRTVAGLAPPTERFLSVVASLDWVLMGASLGLLGWAFGGRVALVAAIFWGTQAASEIGWTGGGFLRQDWLFAAMASLALLRKGWPFAAGCALAVAGLLRLFPLLLFAGPAVLLVSGLVRARTVPSDRWRFFAGATATASVVALVTLHAVGTDSYARFWEHIQLRHTSAITNHMSLRTLFAFAPDARLGALVDDRLVDPGTSWANARAARLSSLAFAYHAGVAGMVLAVVFTSWRLRTPWLAVALSLPLIPAMTDPACYYYSVWVLSGVVLRARPAVGVTLLGVAAAGQLLVLQVRDHEVQYVVLALLYVVSAVVLVTSFTDGPLARLRRFRERRRANGDDGGAERPLAA